MHLAEAQFVSCLRWALARSLPSWRSGGCCGLCNPGLFLPNQPSLQSRTRLELVSGHGDHPPGSRAHTARGSPDPPWPYGEQRARGELGKRCFPEPRHIGAEVGSPSTVQIHRMQLPKARFVPCLRWGNIWLPPELAKGGGLWGLWKPGLFLPNQPSPRRRTCLQ